jgi:putative membrane-bound dehydrogenase-like protein
MWNRSSRWWAMGLALALLPTAGPGQPKGTPGPMAAKEVAAKMTLPPGFQATLFAAEPEVVQPIAFTFDDRGRMWVVECLSYPHWIKDGKPGKDRIVILEDTDGDGVHDKRTVFYDKGANFSGIQLGFGGVWVTALPNLLFIPDANQDDAPDGPPRVVLDGWNLNCKHNVFNSLTWGPDGWLYGLNGITATSQVGRPSTPDKDRVPMNCGVWRFHPTKEKFEVVCHGTTNPFGLDFDEHGEIFFTNCVIKHLWHALPGAHYQRMFGQDFNPNVYHLIESCADHIHWGGGAWTDSRGGKGAHDSPGGGHAHAGCMVYLSDHFPAEFRNSVFTCNLHGSRVNRDSLHRVGSGYVAKHEKDFLTVPDPWYRGLAIHQGPEGAVYISDWSDTGECHNYDIAHLTSGRIYRVSHGKTTPLNKDLSKLTDHELVELQTSSNEWMVRHARRLMQERIAARVLSPDVAKELKQLVKTQKDAPQRLRALWALYCIGSADRELLLPLLNDTQPTVRAWAVTLLVEDGILPEAAESKLVVLAKQEKDSFVRMKIASALQRLPSEQRWSITEALAAKDHDASDTPLSLMLWYAIEPAVPKNVTRALGLLQVARQPLLRECIARRIVGDKANLENLAQLLAKVEDDAVRADVLRGIGEAWQGVRQVPMPKSWPTAYARLSISAKDEVRDRAMLLATVFGDQQALASMKAMLVDSSAPVPARESALRTLLTQKNADLLPALQKLLDDAKLRGPALRGLAAFGEPSTPALILKHYGEFASSEKADALQTLASRPAYALALLDAVEAGQVPRRDVSAFTVRQIQSLKDKQVAQRLEKVWGVIRPASAEKAKLATRYKSLLTADTLKQADLANGRTLYNKTCASCHVLFGEGGKVGPEITGAQRGSLDYWLDNILDPSAVVPKEYQVTVFEMKDGRVVNGVLLNDGEVVTIQTLNEVLRVPRGDIDTRSRSSLSLMPEGLFSNLSDTEVRDLIAYLSSKK